MKKILIGFLFIVGLQSINSQHLTVDVKIIDEGFVYQKAPFSQCHSSTLVELDNGNIMAAWFGGTHERHPDVSIYSAVYNGEKWSELEEIANGVVDDSIRYPTWNPVLFKNNNGALFLYYKVGPSPSEWWGMYKTSEDDGKTWSEAKKLPDSILGPIKNKPIQLNDGTIISPSSTEDGNIWRVHMEISSDEGYTWKKVSVDPESEYKAIQPTLIKLADGTIKALIRSDQNVIMESESTDEGKTWTKLKKTDIANPNSGIDAITLKDGNHLLVYNPMTSGKNWWEGRSRLHLAFSKDGRNWDDIYILENQEEGEYSYPAIIQAENGMIYITYTYDRKKIKYYKLKIMK
ncbi:exo-alpha-sialidase [Galbibacter sp. EGI 63066]|uniref:sialidase family protein n=1 Tax=Galbibacter sp. EGI 63066 TaxID=2993559 RepID=UPI0022494BBE|nr:sialidase family protein [Galbibacter sp. EGI 63066]MCX2678676.1 exo-alpha-sialidase [Galbibacter sp. EGI 63066]